MGLFSLVQRRTSQGEQSDGHKAKSRLTIRNVLSIREARQSTPSAAPPACAEPTGPGRFVATSKKLGSGAYGAVLLGRDLVNHAPVAIKFIPDGRMRSSSLEREVNMLQKLSDANHPSLVRFYGHVKPADAKAGVIRTEGTLPLPKPHTTCHALVMEAARGGELFDHVVGMEGLKETEAAQLYAQLADAVCTAHGLGIAHRDLKLENVLLIHKKNALVADASGGKPPSSIKLIDWGLAHQHAMAPDGRVVPEMLHSRCGSRSYMAPEVTNRDISGTIGYDGFAADMWSLGVCLFAMHLAFFPFERAEPEQDWRARRVVEAQREGKSTMATILAFYPQKAANGGLSAALLALLDRLLVFDPAKRATMAEVLCSEWLAPHVSAATYQRTIAQPLRLATRTSSSTVSEGSLTPRSNVDDESVLSWRPSLHLADLPNATSASGVASAIGRQSFAASVAAEAGWLKVGVGEDADVPPPPPSPLRKAAPTHMQVVVAGASGQRSQLAVGSPKHARYHSSADRESAPLASLLAKTCKISDAGSPRRPDRDQIAASNGMVRIM